MLDLDLQSLRTASANGDSVATARLAMAEQRQERPSFDLWSLALIQDPTSEAAKAGYLSAGGFYVEPHDDPILGNSWKTTNLKIGNQTANLLMSRDFIDGGRSRTVDQWLDYSVNTSHDVSISSPIIDFSFKRAMYEHRFHPVFRQHVESYARDELRNEARMRIAAKLTYHDNAQATLEDITLDRTRHARRITVPTLRGGYAVLAHPQADTLQAIPATLPANLLPFLTELMGTNYQETILAIQYFTERRQNRDLSEVLQWIPSGHNRTQHPEYTLTLSQQGGPEAIDWWYEINCSVRAGTVRPATGWRRVT